MSGILAPKVDKGLQQQQAELQKQQSDLLAQQTAEKAQLRKKTNKQALDIMRSRFAAFGGSSSGGNEGMSNPVADTSANLFTRLTGR